MMNRGRSVTQSGICALLVGCVLWAVPGASFAQGLSVDERLERLEQKTLSQAPGAEQETGNMVFFRGGWAGLVNDRSNEVETDVFGLSGLNDKNTGYYVGAGLDLVLSKNLWGMLSNTWALGEIGVEFKPKFLPFRSHGNAHTHL